jgi:folate-binding protein YgfZ
MRSTFFKDRRRQTLRVSSQEPFVFAAFCNPKGRVIADVLAVIVHAEQVMIRGRQAVMAALAAHLKPYLSFSKSTLTHSDWCISCRTAHTGEATPEHTALMHFDAAAIVGIEIPRGHGLVECWQASESEARTHDTARLPLAKVDMTTARARVELDTIGAYLPQDLNYDLNGTVSFTKGCYTGQEIVARLHYRGTPKRRLYRASLDNTLDDRHDAIAPGARLSNQANRAVGSVVNRVSQDGAQQLLIELTPEAASDSVFLSEPERALFCHSSLLRRKRPINLASLMSAQERVRPTEVPATQKPSVGRQR